MAHQNRIDLHELEKVTYLDYSRLGGDRLVPLLPFLNEEGQWEMWWPSQDGLISMQSEPVVGDYFAKEPERETDIYFDFINVMAKHAYWPDISFFIDGIRSDLHNLGASMAKMDLFFEISKEQKEASHFAATETEYIFTVCRSMFDLLQEVISKLWNRVQIEDQTINKRTLPQHFSKMVLFDKELKSVEQIINKHHIPEPLALFYYQTGPFFIKVKNYRDEIIHSGKSFKLVFATERGFAVTKDTEPFSWFNVWDEKDILHNNLASLRSVIAYVISETIAVCNRYAATLKRTIKLPPDIAPGYHIFIRGYHTDQLLRLEKILTNEPWWK